jgi:peroxiredoxin
MLPVGAARAAKPDAEQLVQNGRRAAAAAQTLQADVVVVAPDGDHFSGTLTAMRPNYFRFRFRNSAGTTECCSDGKQLFFSAPGSKGSLRLPMAPGAQSAESLADFCPPAVAFLSPDRLPKPGAFRATGSIGVATEVGHEQYSGIELLDEASTIRSWFFNASGFPAGASLRHGTIASVWVQNIRLDAPMRPRDFLFELPAGQKSLMPDESAEGLRPVGSALPDFTLPRVDGFQFSLAGRRKTGKATLVYFGSRSAAENREDLPQLQRLSERLRPQQVEVILVSRHGAADVVRTAAREAGIRFTQLHDENGTVSRTARLSENQAPASYLIDADGRILWAGTRPDAAQIEAALGR